MTTKKSTFAKVLAAFLILFTINSCNKIEPDRLTEKNTETKTEQNEKQISGNLVVLPLNFNYSKNIEVPLGNANDRKLNTSSLVCGDYAYTVSLLYTGFKDEGNCSGGRTITISWLVGFPSDPDDNTPGINPVLGPNSIGKFRLPGFTNNWTTAPLYLSDEIGDEDYICHLPPYRNLGYLYKVVTASFQVSEAEYNFVNDFDFTLSLQTDCAGYVIEPTTFMSDTFDQNAYRVYTNFNTTPGVGQFTILDIHVICIPVHGPQLGTSPLHTYKYRPYDPNRDPNDHSGWTSIYITDPFQSVTVTNVAAGQYEYKSKGVLYGPYPPGVESRYTSISPPFTVQ